MGNFILIAYRCSINPKLHKARLELYRFPQKRITG